MHASEAELCSTEALDFHILISLVGCDILATGSRAVLCVVAEINEGFKQELLVSGVLLVCEALLED